MDITDMLSRPMSIGRDLATSKAIRHFAHKFGLVYFGAVNQHEESRELIRGITFAATHSDRHFCVGDVRGHDVSLVERQDVLTRPEQAPQRYHWLILQIDLHVQGLPMIFMDAHHHDTIFYERIFMQFANLTFANALFEAHDPLFGRTFRAYSPADRFEAVEQLISSQITAMLAHHFRQFDYEINGEHLLVYAYNPVVTPHLLQEMLRVGSWLAGALESQASSLVKMHENR